MAEYIGCRNCDSPSCKGCNIYTLGKMLNAGKFDCLMNGNRSINPFADVVEVVHGRWQRESVPIKNMEIVRYRDTCSECGAKAEFLYRDSHYNFCHNCGAKMDGE